MKTKAILSVIVALILVSSMAAAAGFTDTLANFFWKTAEPAADAAPQECTANADCTSGTSCTSCKCIAKLEAATPSLSMPTKTPTITATAPTPSLSIPTKTPTITAVTPKKTAVLAPLLGKVINVNLPLPNAEIAQHNTETKTAESTTTGSGTASTSGALGAADTTINTCLSECRARCRTECGTTGTSTGGGAGASTGTGSTTGCTTNADCASGYCNPNRICATCTLNSQCGTGKVCIIANPDLTACYPLQANGGVCNENADCASNNCANVVTLGATRIGTCAAALATVKTPLTLSSGLRLNIPATGAAIALPLVRSSTGTLTASTGIIVKTNLAINAVCTSASQCASKICSMQTATATAAARRVCSTTCKVSATNECETGKVCSSGRCIVPLANGVTCTSNAQCSSTYCDTIRKVCAAKPANANQNTAETGTGSSTTGTAAGSSASASTALSSGIPSISDCTSGCEARCEETCNPKIANGAVCNKPAHCGEQCASGAFECFCEENAVRAGGLANKGSGEACDANPQCVSGYCDKVFPDRQGTCAGEGTTGDKAIGEECSANTQCQTGRCQLMQSSRVLRLSAGPDAVCAEQLEKDLEEGEPCYTHSQCKSNYCNMADRICAPTPAAIKQPSGERCVNNEDCESNYCSTNPETLEKNCAEQAVEALTLEVQTQAKAELNNVMPQLEMMERQVVEDKFVASREALVAMNPSCFGEITDVEQEAECLIRRFERVTNSLQDNAVITPEQATGWKEKVKKNAAAGETISVPTPPLAAQVSFVNRVKNLFRLTGGFALIETEVQVGTAGEELPVIQAIPTDYLNDLNTQYSQLAALETDICSKYPTTLTSASVLKSCSTDCRSASGILKCVSGKCRVNKEDVCPTGEFGAASVQKAYGEACAASTECLTGLCRIVQGLSATCACTTNANCPTGQICASPGRCISTTRKIYGETCSTGAECESTLCVSRAGTSTCACRTDAHCLVGQICTAERRCIVDIPSSPEEGMGFMEGE